MWDAQRRSYISVAAAIEMSLKQQALHLAALGLLLRLNLVEVGVVGCDWRPTKPPAGRIRSPLEWWRLRWGSTAAQRSDVDMDSTAEMMLQYLLLTYSYGTNYRKNRCMSRLL